MMKKWMKALACIAAFAALQAPANATPITDEVFGCSWNNGASGGCPAAVPNAGQNWFSIFAAPNGDGTPATATPSAGVEFNMYISSDWRVAFDIGDGLITIDYVCANCGWAGYEFAVTGIDSVDITSLSLVSAGGLNLLGSSFTSDSMRMSFAGATGSHTAVFAYTAVPAGGSTEVPEPATLALLLPALLALGVARRKQA